MEKNNLPEFKNPPPPPLAKEVCNLCGDECQSFFNIKMKLVRVCSSCADAILCQQTKWHIENQDRLTNRCNELSEQVEAANERARTYQQQFENYRTKFFEEGTL